jgi:hypothetical protein
MSMTAEQIAFVASLPDDIKLRYEEEIPGETIVVADWGDKTLRLYEDGTRFVVGLNGMSMFKWERCINVRDMKNPPTLD